MANIQPSWPHAWSITYIYDAFSWRYFLKKSILEKVERLRISRYSKDFSSVLYSTSIYKTPVHVLPKLLSMTHTHIISDMNAKELRNRLKHIKSITNGMCISETFLHVRLHTAHFDQNSFVKKVRWNTYNYFLRSEKKFTSGRRAWEAKCQNEKNFIRKTKNEYKPRIPIDHPPFFSLNSYIKDLTQEHIPVTYSM